MSGKDWIFIPTTQRYYNMGLVISVARRSDRQGEVVFMLLANGSEMEFRNEQDKDVIMRYVQGLME